MFYSTYASARLFSVATENNSPTNKWIVAANKAFISTINQVKSTEIKNKIKEFQIRIVKGFFYLWGQEEARTDSPHEWSIHTQILKIIIHISIKHFCKVVNLVSKKKEDRTVKAQDSYRHHFVQFLRCSLIRQAK